MERARKEKEKKKLQKVFMLTSLEFLKEKKLFEAEFYFGCNVIQKSSSDILFFLPLRLTEIRLKKDKD